MPSTWSDGTDTLVAGDASGHDLTVAVESEFVKERTSVPDAQTSLSHISLRRMNQGTNGAL